MYITRFTTVDNEIQDYAYHNVKDADYHLQLFLNDDSGLYRNICVLDDENMNVLGILPFKDGKPQKLIVHGSTVKIKPEWCSPGGEKYSYRVSNIHEQYERARITCLNSSLSLGSCEDVDLDIIEPV
ncbi:hypothetical protein JS518_14060 [Clostridiales bacterium FE2010]|nr:hypothetical protein JS518_14060 [Clostridiales bacterium FE2010]